MSYGSLDVAERNLGIHRVIEALKHMFAIRMNLGDPNLYPRSEIQTLKALKHLLHKLFSVEYLQVKPTDK